MLHEIVLSAGEKNYRWFCKMFNLWSDVMFNRQIEINNDSIKEYFKDVYCYKFKYYGEFIKFELKQCQYYQLDYIFIIQHIHTTAYWVFFKDDNKYQIHSNIKKDMLKFNYYLDGISQRKHSKNSI